jgi:monofunctional biosynthetic peptidoglycan transglycosylase
MGQIGRQLGRLVVLLVLAFAALQLFFGARIGLMALLDPASTTFQRSEAWRLATQPDARWRWQQQWVPGARLSPHLKRAVIASEDAGFADHTGVDWDAIERAIERNERAEALAEKRKAPAKVVGGSTITQQLAKNLFLSGERTPVRKGQELVLAYALEALLDKRRILEIYLNHVEWGEGVFGAQAAARHYHRVDADKLQPMQAARLAVMLPAPKRFEKRPASRYLSSQASTIAARMPAVEVP